MIVSNIAPRNRINFAARNPIAKAKQPQFMPNVAQNSTTKKSLLGMVAALALSACGNSFPELDWNPNVRVLAAGTQTTEVCGPYQEALIAELKSENINTLEEANQSLSQKGWKGSNCIEPDKTYFPVTTPGENFNIWNKNEANPNRFVLISTLGEEYYINRGTYMKQQLKEIYQVPEENIIVETPSDTGAFEGKVKELAQKVSESELAGNTNPEVLIYHTGHGNSDATDSNEEGAYNGYVKLNNGTLEEYQVKQILKDNIPTTPLLLIMQTCMSGAWIADARQPQKTLIQNA